MTRARQIHQIDGPFRMQNGVIQDPQIAYETWGELNFPKDNAILLFTGLSPSAHAASSDLDPSNGWWEQMVGPGLPIDTSKYLVICVNSLGSCFGSTGPSSTNPETNKIYGLQFPVLTLEDVARAGHEVVKSLGLNQLYAVVGASMGGMTALAYSVLFPEVPKSLVCISSAARALPYSIALRSLQREIIRTDPAWNDGKYTDGPVVGMQLARKLGMLTYRSAAEFQQRFGRELVSEEEKQVMRLALTLKWSPTLMLTQSNSPVHLTRTVIFTCPEQWICLILQTMEDLWQTGWRGLVQSGC